MLLLFASSPAESIVMPEISCLVCAALGVQNDIAGLVAGAEGTAVSGVVQGSSSSTASGFVSGVTDAAVFRGGFVQARQSIESSTPAVFSGRPESSVQGIFRGCNQCSASALLIGEEVLSEPLYGAFTVKNMSDPDISASGEDIYTVLSLRFDYDWATGEFKKALLLEAPGLFKHYGRITRTLEAKWLKSPRQAYLLGERLLGYLARPRGAISFSTGIRAASIPPGAWVDVSHPYVPVSGRMLVMNSELDPSAAEVRLTVEAIVGAEPEIVLAKLSETYAPQLPDGISVTYAAGHATFTICDEDGKPLPGAKVTLDGGLTLSTNSFGTVSFPTGRGAHHLKIEATGYITQELDVTV